MSDENSREPGPKYLGDGVYASFDGYQIWLHLGAHDNPALIAIEPNVYESLKNFAQRAWRIKT